MHSDTNFITLPNFGSIYIGSIIQSFIVSRIKVIISKYSGRYTDKYIHIAFFKQFNVNDGVLLAENIMVKLLYLNMLKSSQDRY